MKKTWILLGCAAGLMLVPARAAEEEHTELGKHMEAMNDAFKAFRSETDAAKGAAEARDAQTALLKGMSEVPELIKDMPEGAERAKALAKYKTGVAKLYVTLCEVEVAFLDGKMDEVTKLVDSLKQQKKAGHKEFMKEKD
jgi:soluble cytochrome b562